MKANSEESTSKKIMRNFPCLILGGMLENIINA